MPWRPLLPLLLTSALATPASAQPLWEAELRLGYGVALEGGGATTTTTDDTALGAEPTMPTPSPDTPAPLTFSAIGAVAIRDQPRMSAYGGLVIEHRNDTGVGVTAGVRVHPGDGGFRLMAGGNYLHAPETRWGASASAGYCFRVMSALRTCGDLQATAYFAGSELEDDQTLTQIQAVLGVAFDSL